MSQADFTLPTTGTVGGLNLVVLLNGIIAALASNNSGPGEPEDRAPGLFWVDTSANPAVLKVRNAADNGWTAIGPTDKVLFGALPAEGAKTVKGITTFDDPVNLDSFRESFISANSGANYAIDCSTSNNFNLTLTANTTLSFTNVPAGVRFGVSLALKQDATGNRTVTWPAAVKWAGGVAPAVTTTANKTDFYACFTDDGGVTWFGFVSGKNY